MPADLTNLNIDETYKGLLHANGSPLTGSDLVQIYDGGGNATAFTLGTDNVGGKINGEFTITRDLSVQGFAYLNSISATDTVIGPPIPKAFVSFVGSSTLVHASYGIDDVNKTAAGMYEINFAEDVAGLLNTGSSPGEYSIIVSITHSDSDIPSIYSCYGDNSSTYLKAVVRCVEYDLTDTVNPVKYFDPDRVHVTIFKN
jgi:hypothetical protein